MHTINLGMDKKLASILDSMKLLYLELEVPLVTSVTGKDRVLLGSALGKKYAITTLFYNKDYIFGLLKNCLLRTVNKINF